MVQAIDRGCFFLVGEGHNIKSVVSLNNVCAATLFLLERMQSGIEVCNIVDPQSFAMRDLAQMMAQLLGVAWHNRSLPVPIAKALGIFGDIVTRMLKIDFPLTSDRVAAMTETTHFSCEKLIQAGFRHPQTTIEGLREMIAWYRDMFPPRKGT
jgi:nucleoside-diphosphate-sugar epimerase